MAETSSSNLKKAKVVLSPLVIDNMHTDELPLELSPLTPISPEDTSTSAPPVLPSGFWHRFALRDSESTDVTDFEPEGPEYSGMAHYLLLPVKWLTRA